MCGDNVVGGRWCAGGGGGSGGGRAVGGNTTWRQERHRNINNNNNNTAISFSNMSIFLLVLVGLGPCLALAMTNPDSLPPGLQCDFERPGECDWEWQEEIPGDIPFSLTTGRRLKETISKQVPGKRLSGVLYDSKNNSDGQFLYLGVPENGELINHTRLIKSPWMEESVEDCRLEAEYNVKDEDTTTKVIIENGNYTRYFTINGVKTDKATAEWKRVSSTIGHLPKQFRLGIEVTMSQQRPTHAAIDNIRLVNCFESVPPGSPCMGMLCETGKCIDNDSFCDITRDCPGGEDESLCDPTPEGSRCDFENGWCGWRNVDGDNMDFNIARGPTNKERTGPGYDHTYQNDTGHYLLSELPTKGKLGDHGVLESPLFDAPPCYHSNTTSPYYESCKLRLYYHKLGRYQGSLIIKVIEYGERGTTRVGYPHILIQIHGDKGTEWVRELLPLPKGIYNKYRIQISNVRGQRFRGDLGIDDITLSPECFGRNVVPEALRCPAPPTIGSPSPGPSDTPTPYVRPEGVVMVTTCGAKGHEGPTSEMCREEYHNTPGQVATVPSSTSLPGTQMWIVPSTGYYTFVAKGASGGSGVQSQDMRTHGAISRATFFLQAETELYILVGQEGMSACRNVPNQTREQQTTCHSRKEPPIASNESKSNLENLKMKINSHTVGGGGGGGGASFVFMMENKNPKALVVGGGGSGLAWSVGEGVGHLQDGQGMNLSLPESHGHALHGGAPYYAGAGGGWERNKREREGNRREQEGQSLVNGGVGGRPCNYYPSVSTYGGFGGGGGGCLAGGGGGGYTGGNAYSGPDRHGEGGYSYTAKAAVFSDIRLGVHSGPGVVFIIPNLKGECGCDHICVPLDQRLREHKCLCDEDRILSDDGKTCIPASGDSYMQTLYAAFIMLGIIVIAVISATSIYCYNRYQRKKFDVLRREFFTERGGPEVQLNQLRASNGGMVTEYNPNYEFGGGTCTIKDLKSVNRNNLTLVKALGQGAFGEVYQGYLKNYAGDSVEMPVAVKTLPEMSSNQAEMDFLMEALIMSKFAHPNIVHFIGVCFDKLPRFIVLELLSGGDLKSFLREARPKPERPSALTMRDLLTCATDVAKGCEYLEGHHFIHRDIAARNCLLTTKGPGRVVKIADFGMARDIYRNDYYRKGGKAMLPVKWMPPEAFLDGIFTSKTDVWSFGVLLWEVMSLGYMPYPGRGNQEVMQLVTNGGRLEPPTNCPGPVYRIMTQCWHPIPEERPTFTTILERLGYCIQDPDVISHALPVFQRPPSAERDATVMRPHENDACLTVSRRGDEPQSPASTDYLIPLPSSYSLATMRSDLNSTPSIDSGTDCCQVDRLLEAAPPPPAWETTSFTTEPPPPTLHRHKPTPPPAAAAPARPPAHTPHMAESQSTQPLLKPSPPGSPHPERLMRPGERTAEPMVPPRDRPRPHHHYHPHCYNNSGSSNNSSSSNSCSSNSSHSANTNSSASTLPLDPTTLPCIPPPLQYVNVNVQGRGAEYDHEPYIIHETREHREISC